MVLTRTFRNLQNQLPPDHRNKIAWKLWSWNLPTILFRLHLNYLWRRYLCIIYVLSKLSMTWTFYRIIICVPYRLFSIYCSHFLASMRIHARIEILKSISNCHTHIRAKRCCTIHPCTAPRNFTTCIVQRVWEEWNIHTTVAWYHGGGGIRL